MENPIPITIIGGFLGSGKTTLLNKLLTHNLGLRAAILVNDYGEVNIDKQLITKRTDEDIIDLPNGCICCTLARGLVEVIEKIVMDPNPPDRIIIESSGLSSPSQIKNLLDLPNLQTQVSIESVITLVDVKNIRRVARAVMFVEDQLQSADILIINKTDLVDETELNDVVKWVSEIAPGTPQIQTQYADVPIKVISGTFDVNPSKAPDHVSNNTNGSHQLGEYLSWTYESTAVLSWNKVEDLFAAMPDSIYRVKGFLYLSQHPDNKCTLQVVNQHIELDCNQTWLGEDPKNQLVFIGNPDSNVDRFIQRFDTCVVEI